MPGHVRTLDGMATSLRLAVGCIATAAALAACGGDTDDTTASTTSTGSTASTRAATTTAAPATTEAPPTTAEEGVVPVTAAVPSVVSVPVVETTPLPTALPAPASTVAPDFGLTPECVDELFGLVAGVEPITAAFDFEGGGHEDYTMLMISLQEPFAAAVEGITEHGCDSIGGLAPPGFEEAFVAEVRKRFAGAAPFFEIVTATPRHPLSNDCQEQADALIAYATDGGTFAELEPVDKYNVMQLYSGLQTWCGLQFGHEVTLRDDVQAFLGVQP